MYNVLNAQIYISMYVSLAIYYLDGFKRDAAEQLKLSYHYRHFELPHVGFKVSRHRQNKRFNISKENGFG